MLPAEGRRLRLLPVPRGPFRPQRDRSAGSETESVHFVVKMFMFMFRSSVFIFSHQASCCSDRLHCCPSNSICDLDHGVCRSAENQTPLMKIPAASDDGELLVLSAELRFSFTDHFKGTDVVVSVVCPDQKSACPDETTCCEMSNGTYGCCPLPTVSDTQVSHKQSNCKNIGGASWILTGV